SNEQNYYDYLGIFFLSHYILERQFFNYLQLLYTHIKSSCHPTNIHRQHDFVNILSVLKVFFYSDFIHWIYSKKNNCNII
ncbi:hypothetical protein Q4595_29935, partial [Wenyingzhuangia sp. 1_MG-2023]|nr:hypothetical protein [Wenyingzhuangia sp. 1_MG-2023]